MRSPSRRRNLWTALAVSGGLGVACNAIFGIEDPVHREDEATGGAAGEVSTGGKGQGGTADGGTSGTGPGTGGKGGAAGTTAGDAGASGDSGSATGGIATGGSATGGTAPGGATGGSAMGGRSTGGSGGGGGQGCPMDPTDCEPASPPSCAGMSKRACAGASCCSSPTVDGCVDCNFPSTFASTVSAFRLDAFEVTVGRFRKYVNAYPGPPQGGQGTQPNVPGTGWSPAWDGLMASSNQALKDNVTRCGADSTYTLDPGANEQKPMNCISWFDAFGFCVWDGGFLPTEIQRTFAAANGDENRYYPWGGNTLDHQHALWGFCGTGGSISCLVSDIADVGSFPLGIGAFGQHDLTGSMWEWVFDYDGGVWPPDDPCTDCANTNPPGGSYRLIRGGGWSQSQTEQPVTYRNANDGPTTFWKNVGVRCARI